MTRPDGARTRAAPAPPQRTVGQLVADSVRFYGRRFWASLPLGVGPAAVTVAAAELPRRESLAVLAVAWPALMTTSYVAACFLVSGRPFGRRRALVAGGVGVLVGLPVPFLVAVLVLPAVLWLALLGMAVPAAVVEGKGFRDSLRRGVALARADFGHAAGALATLVLLVVLTQLVLFQLLAGLSDQTLAVAAFLANLVISPLLFLGGAHLYYDQIARLEARK